MLEVTKAIDSGAGVLYVYGNYTGDIMNFEMASEMADMEDIRVEHVLGAEDVASAPKGEESKRRGVAGIFYVYKIAGAYAEEMASLDEVKRIAEKVCGNVRTMGVALSPCTIPEVGKPTFEIGENEMVSATIQGFASGIIVALAIMVGLSSGTETWGVVLSGVVVIAFVEGFSDAFSEYLSRRTDETQRTRSVFKDAFIVFGTKTAIILQFLFPFIILPREQLTEATQFAIFWGLFILSIMSGYIARKQVNRRVVRTMSIYLGAAIIIITITYFIGDLIVYIFWLLGVGV